ncbi:unnamed protein product [Polarella glacialis]|uniref:Insulin-degrading enzyme n=1 Tax=Polarella glacialis TaxID=89957 RepID=A0A813F215_POLGL|nr:unnamed protein product [Polarella glacialis]
MLFLGTGKYPGEDEYTRFLGEHGGESNACTGEELTTYHFRVSASHLEGALDRFSHFFLSPLFDVALIAREVNAVDSENTNYSTEECWRQLQLQKTTAAPGHMFTRFDVGSLQTFGGSLEGAADALREELILWNEEYYRAGAMNLVLLGKESLEELQELAEALFGQLRSGTAAKSKAAAGLPWPVQQLGRILYCLPLKEVRTISVCWPLPAQTQQLFAKPELYIGHLLGHEGEGSLHDVLNQLGWVDELSAGLEHDFDDQQLFSLSLILTPEGDAHQEEVLALLFQYVALCRNAGPQDVVFREIQALQEIAFAHREDACDPDELAASIANALHRYPAQEAIRGPSALDEWSPTLLSSCLDLLTPEKSLVFISSPDFSEQSVAPGATGELAPNWQREKWYGVVFREEAIGQERLALWGEDPEEESGLQLPEPNEFVPLDFSLRAVPGSGSHALATSRLPLEMTAPVLLFSEPFARLWHKTDYAFKTPRESVMALIYTRTYESGPEAVMMMRMFCGLLEDELSSFAYDAQVAGLDYHLQFTDNLALTVSGFNDKLPKLLEVVMDRMAELIQAAEDAAAGEAEDEDTADLLERLDNQRQILLQEYTNFPRDEPYEICGYYASQLLHPGYWHFSEYIEVLQRPADLGAFSRALRSSLSSVQLEVLVHGNADARDAEDAMAFISDALEEIGSEVLKLLPRQEVLQLPESSTTIFQLDLEKDNPEQENSCTWNLYQLGPLAEKPKLEACLALVCHVAESSAFQQLRTQEQLGYIVEASTWKEHDSFGLAVVVQGTRLPPKDVDIQIEAWLASFGQELRDMSDEEFASQVESVLSKLTRRYTSLSQETRHHWSEIRRRRYDFLSRRRVAESLEALRKEDVDNFFNEHLAVRAPLRRKLSVRVLGSSATGEGKTDDPATLTAALRSVQDIRAFQAAGTSFPLPALADVPTPSVAI